MVFLVGSWRYGAHLKKEEVTPEVATAGGGGGFRNQPGPREPDAVLVQIIPGPQNTAPVFFATSATAGLSSMPWGHPRKGFRLCLLKALARPAAGNSGTGKYAPTNERTNAKQASRTTHHYYYS